MSATSSPTKRTVSERMIQANRENARKSTGPNTDQGKRRCSQNAVKHGVFAHHMAINDEEDDEYQDFRLAMLVELNPANELELRQAEVVINCHWRLRRVDAAEMKLLSGYERSWQGGGDDVDEARFDSSRALARVLREKDKLWNNLSTYQQRLLNQAHRAMRELRALRKESIVTLGDCRDEQLSPFFREELVHEGYELTDGEDSQAEQHASEPEESHGSDRSEKTEPFDAVNPGVATDNESDEQDEQDEQEEPRPDVAADASYATGVLGLPQHQ